MLDASGEPVLANARILVCEDSATIREFLRWLLEPLYDVSLARTGEAAIAAVPEFQPDVILCDLMLPGIPGTEVCRRLRAMPEEREVPFVLVTALGGDESRALGLEAGADDYLVKPIRDRELLARVASLVRLRRAMQSLEERGRRLQLANAALRASEDTARLRAERLRELASQVNDLAGETTAPLSSRLARLAAELQALTVPPMPDGSARGVSPSPCGRGPG